jgi:hypothetical protein
VLAVSSVLPVDGVVLFNCRWYFFYRLPCYGVALSITITTNDRKANTVKEQEIVIPRVRSTPKQGIL